MESANQSDVARSLSSPPGFLGFPHTHFSVPQLASCGLKGSKPIQEDAWVHWRSPRCTVSVLAVFDGHGGFEGSIASSECRAVLVQALESTGDACESWSEPEWKRRLAGLFERMHVAIRDKLLHMTSPVLGSGSVTIDDDAAPSLHQRFVDSKGVVRFPNGQPVHGGTTASVCVVQRVLPSGDWRLVCANVGDSLCLLYPQSGNYEFLSVDHGPESEEEYARIQSLDPTTHPIKITAVYDKRNVLRKFECPRVFREDGTKDPLLSASPWEHGLHPTNVRYEPSVYAVTSPPAGEDTLCIAMTRSLGDFYGHPFGLTHRPSITVHTLPSDADFAVVVASDGVWDSWKYEDLGALLQTQRAAGMDIERMAQAALSESLLRAAASFGVSSLDDASLALLVVAEKAASPHAASAMRDVAAPS